MPKKRYVNGVECRTLLTEMARKRAPVSVTNKADELWQVYKSQIISVRGNMLVIAQPVPDQADCHLEPASGQEVAISFKKGYNKYLFITKVAKLDQYEMEFGDTIPVVCLYAPDHIEKVQRRAFTRADIPENEPVTVTLRRHGGSAELSRGWIANLSAGGLGMRINEKECPPLAENEQVTLQFMPLPNQKPVQVSARFRHTTEPDAAGRVTLGLQFIGLEINEEGRNTLRRISRAVSVYLRKSPLAKQRDASHH